MSVARHNPQDAQGGAKALMWDERLAEEAKHSLPAQFELFTDYRLLYKRATMMRENIEVNESHQKEQYLLRKKRLDNMRIAGPKDGMKGTFNDDNIGGDPWWYKKQLEKDGKLPIGPKTHFQHDDFITEMTQTASIFNTLSPSQKKQYIPVHYPTTMGNTSGGSILNTPHEVLLEQQFVDSHMMYVSLLGIQKDIDLTDELREKISNGLRREFHFLKHNPAAKSKDFSDILTNYQKLGKPSSFNEEEKLFQEQQTLKDVDTHLRSLDINDKSLLLATKDKLQKLRGNVGIQQQIKAALEFSQNALQRTISLQSNPDFYELTPEERAEYINFLKEDLQLEQERLDRNIKLSVSEIQQLREYDRIQLLPQDRIPYLPLPRFASHDINTLNSVPYIPNTASGYGKSVTHPFLFDTKNIYNPCMPIAIEYMQCLRANQWAANIEDVPACNRASNQLFQCQQHETAVIQANSNQSWGKILTKWLWGESSDEVDGGNLNDMMSFIQPQQQEQPQQQQQQQQQQYSTQNVTKSNNINKQTSSSIILSPTISPPSNSNTRLYPSNTQQHNNTSQYQNTQLNPTTQQQQQQQPHATMLNSRPYHLQKQDEINAQQAINQVIQPKYIEPTIEQRQEFNEMYRRTMQPSPVSPDRYYQAQEQAKAEKKSGWLTSWSLPFFNRGDDDDDVNDGENQRRYKNDIRSNQLPPLHSSISGQATSPELIYSQLHRQQAALLDEDLALTGPLDKEQQELLKKHHQYMDGMEENQLAPHYRRYHPFPTGPKSKYKSTLFNSDHMYLHWRDTPDIDAMVDADWEHLEKYGTATPTPDNFVLLRTDDDELFQRVDMFDKMKFEKFRDVEWRFPYGEDIERKEAAQFFEHNRASIDDRHGAENARDKPKSSWW